MSIFDQTTLATRTWALIQRNPTTITFDRRGTNPAPQTVRVVMGSSTGSSRGVRRNEAGGQAELRGLVIYGIRNHPDVTIADTDIRMSDRFAIGTNEVYEVKDLIVTPGGVQAFATRVSG